MDYGAIGAVIGHEISHSFDDQGAQFDAQGRCATGGRRRTSRTSRPRGEAGEAVRRVPAAARTCT
jgi:endothelin-converting enzyme/putative endopeptidase